MKKTVQNRLEATERGVMSPSQEKSLADLFAEFCRLPALGATIPIRVPAARLRKEPGVLQLLLPNPAGGEWMESLLLEHVSKTITHHGVLLGSWVLPQIHHPAERVEFATALVVASAVDERTVSICEADSIGGKVTPKPIFLPLPGLAGIKKCDDDELFFFLAEPLHEQRKLIVDYASTRPASEASELIECLVISEARMDKAGLKTDVEKFGGYYPSPTPLQRLAREASARVFSVQSIHSVRQ